MKLSSGARRFEAVSIAQHGEQDSHPSPNQGDHDLVVPEDGVPFVEEERKLLQRFRRVRNDLVHGCSRGTLSQDDLKRSKAFVNRMLVYRVSRLATPTSTGTER